MTLLEVVEAVDGTIRGHAPLSQIEDPAQLDRRLETLCGKLAEDMRKALAKTKISDLAKGGG
jgi:DNA-binding IscR family transcriptional regulator